MRRHGAEKCYPYLLVHGLTKLRPNKSNKGGLTSRQINHSEIVAEIQL